MGNLPRKIKHGDSEYNNVNMGLMNYSPLALSVQLV